MLGMRSTTSGLRAKALPAVLVCALLVFVPAFAASGAATVKDGQSCSKVNAVTGNKAMPNTLWYCMKEGKSKKWRKGLSFLDLALTYCTDMYDGTPILTNGIIYSRSEQVLSVRGVNMEGFATARMAICFLDAVDAPESVRMMINQTRPIDGMQKQTFQAADGGRFQISWTVDYTNILNFILQDVTSKNKKTFMLEPSTKNLKLISMFESK